MLCWLPYRFTRLAFKKKVGFPSLVESIAPLQVRVLPRMNNMRSHQIPNHLVGLTFEDALAFLPC